MLKTEYADALEILGYVHYRLGRLQDARTVFEGLLAMDPASAVARKHLAAIFLALEKPAEALEQLEIFLENRRLGKAELPALLMHARILWLLGKKEESRAVMLTYSRESGAN
jgi:tetratricopeptide (TPR) repeat protein